ncbi:hypothetical protein B0J11DRAFT_583832 [Dendryphion nanum]|uniref:Uncharacterized protein n=1 Tax=Dendryphion nanum TaxID=256645 RepID=A0A9P9IF59_9PLEO|nr:hypothetical protein B0J11DRAFT_583832 [Dendryphion nanum]
MTLLTILDLPAELLLEILEHFNTIRGFFISPTEEHARQIENRIRIQALHALALTCQQIHGFAIPLLYKSFIQSGADQDHALSPAKKLLNAFICNPGRMRHLEYLEILRPEREDSLTLPLIRANFTLACKEWDMLAGELEHLNWRNTVKLQVPLNPNDTFAFWFRLGLAWRQELPKSYITVLILLAPNLQDVAILDPGSFYTQAFSQRQSALRQRLHRIWLNRYPSHPYEGYETLFSSLMKPNLERIFSPSDLLWLGNPHQPKHTRGLGGHDLFTPERQRIQGPIELVLEACELSHSSLQKIVDTFIALRSFTCRWGINDGRFSEAVPSQIDLPGMNSILSAHASTLHSLILDTLDSGWLVSMDQNIPGIGSLQHFPALQYLDVSGLVIWGDCDDGYGEIPFARLLPPNLEILVIKTEWDDDVEWSLLELSRDCKALLPKLRLIDCSWRPAVHSDVTIALVDQFQAAGVELRLQI